MVQTAVTNPVELTRFQKLIIAIRTSLKTIVASINLDVKDNGWASGIVPATPERVAYFTRLNTILKEQFSGTGNYIMVEHKGRSYQFMSADPAFVSQYGNASIKLNLLRAPDMAKLDSAINEGLEALNVDFNTGEVLDTPIVDNTNKSFQL